MIHILKSSRMQMLISVQRGRARGSLASRCPASQHSSSSSHLSPSPWLYRCLWGSQP